jgi:hypothetical protein
MPTAVIVLIVLGAAGGLFALAWWSSGRSKGHGYRTSGDHEVARGMGTLQGSTHNPPGEQGRSF